MDQKKQVEFKLYLGRNVPGGREVDETEMALFFKAVVDPVLESYSILTGLGTWKGQNELIFVMVYIGEDEHRDRNAVKQIGLAYKRRFAQEAVFMTETRVMTEMI